MSSIKLGLSRESSEFLFDLEEEKIKNPTGFGRKVCTRKDFSALFDLFTTNQIPFPIVFSCQSLFSDVNFTREMWSAFFNGFPGDATRVYNFLSNYLDFEIAKKEEEEKASLKRARKEKLRKRQEKLLAAERSEIATLRSELQTKIQAIEQGRDENLFATKKARVADFQE